MFFTCTLLGIINLDESHLPGDSAFLSLELCPSLWSTYVTTVLEVIPSNSSYRHSSAKRYWASTLLIQGPWPWRSSAWAEMFPTELLLTKKLPLSPLCCARGLEAIDICLKLAPETCHSAPRSAIWFWPPHFSPLSACRSTNTRHWNWSFKSFPCIWHTVCSPDIRMFCSLQ